MPNSWTITGIVFTWIVSVLHTAAPALANTEIINFLAGEDQHVALPALVSQWPTLRYERNEARWSVSPAPLGTAIESVCELPPAGLSPSSSSDGSDSPIPEWTFSCPHELWVTLDLAHKEWERHSKFTLRLSWPASFPADFDIKIYDPKSLSAHLSQFAPQMLNASTPRHPTMSPSPTRKKYARIRLVDTGILTPSVSLPKPPPPPAPVPFNLILEPLYYGILPASVVPILLFLIPVLAFAGLLVPRINAYLETIARQARREISGEIGGEKEE